MKRSRVIELRIRMSVARSAALEFIATGSDSPSERPELRHRMRTQGTGPARKQHEYKHNQTYSHAGVSVAYSRDEGFALCDPRLSPRALPRPQARNGSKEPRLNDPTPAMSA